MRDPRDDRGPDDPLPGDNQPDDDQAMYDRAFAELIAHFDSTDSEPPEPRATDSGSPDPAVSDPAPADPAPAESDAPGPLPPFHFRLDDVDLTEEDDEPVDEVPESEQFVPPNPSWPRPSAPVFVGWLGLGYAIVAMLLIAFGVPLPRFVGWLAVLGFVGGLALLLSRLPRHRPPDGDDGARL
ncbi:MAG TPA: DoxX family protein [Microlunatus sp.]